MRGSRRIAATGPTPRMGLASVRSALLLLVVAVVALGACRSMGPAGSRDPVDAATGPLEATSDVEPERGGAQLWSENCMRCHNYRWPRERSDRDWDVIVHHMRVRANLTAEEHRKILQFLQSAN